MDPFEDQIIYNSEINLDDNPQKEPRKTENSYSKKKSENTFVKIIAEKNNIKKVKKTKIKTTLKKINNNLIGKLYYTVLVSRWREAHTLRNYGELINDFGGLKEENFILEKDNKLLTENLQQVNEALHKEIISNIKMMDKIENLENGILDGTIVNKNTKMNPLEEMKKLVSMLKEDKKESTQKLIMRIFAFFECF